MQTDGEAGYQRFTPFDEVASPNKRFDCVFFDFVTRTKRNIHVGLESQVQSLWGRSFFFYSLYAGGGAASINQAIAIHSNGNAITVFVTFLV